MTRKGRRSTGKEGRKERRGTMTEGRKDGRTEEHIYYYRKYRRQTS